MRFTKGTSPPPHQGLPWSLTAGHRAGLLQPPVVLLDTTESPAQRRGNQQGLELHRALPPAELRIAFCKLLAGWVYFSLFLRWAIIWQVTGSVNKTQYASCCQLPTLLHPHPTPVLYTPETQGGR